jgi:hypothetical protein
MMDTQRRRNNATMRRWRDKRRMAKGDGAFKKDQRERKRAYRRRKSSTPEVETKVPNATSTSTSTSRPKSTDCKSLSRYQRNLHLLRAHIYGDNECTDVDVDVDWLEDYDTISRWLQDESGGLSFGSRATYCNSIAALLKRAPHREPLYRLYSALNVKLAAAIKRRSADNMRAPNKLHTRAWPTLMTQLHGAGWRDLNFGGAVTPSLALCCAYTLFPPRRLLDYQYMRLATAEGEATDRDFNYLLLIQNDEGADATFVFRRYKTSYKYGEQRFAVPPVLLSRLLAHIDAQGLRPGDLLFGSRKGSPYSNFSQVVRESFRRCAGVPLTVNDIRHAYITFKLTTAPFPSINEKKRLATLMAHSKSMQEMYVQLDLK